MAYLIVGGVPEGMKGMPDEFGCRTTRRRMSSRTVTGNNNTAPSGTVTAPPFSRIRLRKKANRGEPAWSCGTSANSRFRGKFSESCRSSPIVNSEIGGR